VCRMETGWVGLDRMWGSFCVCCVSFVVVGGAEGKCGWVLGRCPKHVEAIKLHTLSHPVGSLHSLWLRCTVT
jgi:hypothetical protein